MREGEREGGGARIKREGVRRVDKKGEEEERGRFTWCHHFGQQFFGEPSSGP